MRPYGFTKHTFVGADVMLSSLSGRPANIIDPEEILDRTVTGRRGRRPLHYTFHHPDKLQFYSFSTISLPFPLLKMAFAGTAPRTEESG